MDDEPNRTTDLILGFMVCSILATVLIYAIYTWWGRY